MPHQGDPLPATLFHSVAALTILLQFAAGVMALRLVRRAGRSSAWLLLGAAILLSALAHLLRLFQSLAGTFPVTLDLPVELGSLAVSLLLLAGIAAIEPFLLALKKRSELYRRIVEANQEGLWIFDREGATTFVNDRFAEMLGWSPGELTGRRLTELVAESSVATANHLSALQESGDRKPVDLCFCTKNGEELWAMVGMSPLFDERGAPDGALLTAMNISHRKGIEEALRNSERFSRATVDALTQGIAILDKSGRILFVNRCWRDLAGQCPLPGPPAEGADYLAALEAHTGPDQERTEAFAGGIRAVLKGALPEFVLEYSRQDDPGARWFLGRVTRFSSDGEPFAVVTHDDITPLKQAEGAVKQLAYHDHLTGLPNRLLLQDRLDQHLVQAGRDQELVAVLFLDLDHFKLVNDTLGHGAGDQLLKIVAERLLGCIRKSDTVARLGGDEFVVVLTGLEHSGDATLIARKILQSLTLPVQLEGKTVFTSTSIGISLFPEDGRIAEILISNADLAMYLAKEQGRNTYRYFSRSLNERAQLRMRQETDLRLALERQELVLYFQDQIALANGRLCGVEALLRWRHPEKGLLLPGEFLPLAEETGLILPIGEWVLRTACQRARAWQKQGLPPVRIAVNLSRRQLADPGLCAMVRNVLEETGMSSAWLELEVTENVFQHDFEQAAQALEALHALGVGIAIDDFGTGFSSLKALRRLPLARLKVDHSFIGDLMRDGQNPAMVRTIIAIAHNMGLKVIAEGVKTERQRGFLMEYGCDEIQGYFLNPPDPEGDWLRLLRNGQEKLSN